MIDESQNLVENLYAEIKNHLNIENMQGFEEKLNKLITANKSFQNQLQQFNFLILKQIRSLVCHIANIEEDIFKACDNDDLRNVKFLIDHNFYDLNTKNKSGETLFNYCTHNKKFNLIEYLILHYPKTYFPPITEKPNDFEPDIIKASILGKLSSVQWLIEKENIDKNTRVEEDDILYGFYKGDTPIHIAATINQGREKIHFFFLE